MNDVAEQVYVDRPAAAARGRAVYFLADLEASGTPFPSAGLRLTLRKEVPSSSAAAESEAPAPIPVSWTPERPGPDPAFDGVLTIVGAPDGGAICALRGTSAPFGDPGPRFDAVLGRRIARAAARRLLRSVRAFVERASPPVDDVGGLRILLITTDDAAAQALRRACGAWKGSLSRSTDLDDGLRMLLAAAQLGCPFDVAIIDVSLPGTSAWDLARAICADALLYETLLVMLAPKTAHVAPDIARSVGFSAVMSKPVSTDTTLEALQRALRDELPQVIPPPAIGETVLLVSGRDPVRDSLVTMLEELGYGVTLQPTVHAALWFAQNEGATCDVVILSLPTSSAHALNVVRAIRDHERRTQAARVPIVVIETTPAQANRIAFAGAGVDDYLIRPVRRETLRRCLARWRP